MNFQRQMSVLAFIGDSKLDTKKKQEFLPVEEIGNTISETDKEHKKQLG